MEEMRLVILQSVMILATVIILTLVKMKRDGSSGDSQIMQGNAVNILESFFFFLHFTTFNLWFQIYPLCIGWFICLLPCYGNIEF